MKKKFTTLFLFAATMITALTLASCGEEVTIDEQPAGGSEKGLAVFSSVSDDTRTTINVNGVFYWQTKSEGGVRTNDQIWIDPTGTTGTSFSLESASSTFENDNRSGKFYFNEVLSGNNYNLSYTGHGSTTGDEVTIKQNQVQIGWNNAEHIGTSGDCATATATRQTGTNNFSFELNHKSAYLILQPYAPLATDQNPYILSLVEIVDLDNNALCGTFPLTMAGLSTDGATNTAARVNLTCTSATGEGLHLPTTPTQSLYAVILPRGAAEGSRPNLQVRYHVHAPSDGHFVVVENISGRYEPNDFREYKHNLSVPEFPTVPTFLSDGNGLFSGHKFKPAFLRRTNGNATNGATLQIDTDPFIVLQYNQGANTTAITEYQKRMWFTWNELVEIFRHATAGNGANFNNHITNSVTIGGKNYTLPTSGQYSNLLETPNSGRATVNYYPASYAAVRVDLLGDATYSTRGWYNNVNASFIFGYLFFPDESVILDSKILVPSLNGRWGTTYSNLTAAELRNYVSHGSIFFPAAGYHYQQLAYWEARGNQSTYWSGSIVVNAPTQAVRSAFNPGAMNMNNTERALLYLPAVLVEK